MKLAAIYNVWDGEEWLSQSMALLKDHVDLFIIVWQEVSNYGEHYNPLEKLDLTNFVNTIFVKFEPMKAGARVNETRKRNIGLDMARQNNCTHFLHMDCDEMYYDFGTAKESYLKYGKKGSACRIYTYFKESTLRFDDEDDYFVPFIHELRIDTTAGVRHYPFYVDPTRRINESDVILLDHHMHHFSWVRNDIERKVRNSTARINIERSSLVKDYYSDLKDGSFVTGRKLIRIG